jgi:hypothetical protein
MMMDSSDQKCPQFSPKMSASIACTLAAFCGSGQKVPNISPKYMIPQIRHTQKLLVNRIKIMSNITKWTEIFARGSNSQKKDSTK